ncbi:MAG: hypothetical protein ACUVTL_06630 [Thermoproteota archaeon]
MSFWSDLKGKIFGTLKEAGFDDLKIVDETPFPAIATNIDKRPYPA